MTDEKNFGPGNPHPLSQMRTELVWEGKYDEYGRRREVDVAGSAMPLQRIETVDKPVRRLGQQELFNAAKAHPDDFRNRLICSDNNSSWPPYASTQTLANPLRFGKNLDGKGT